MCQICRAFLLQIAVIGGFSPVSRMDLATPSLGVSELKRQEDLAISQGISSGPLRLGEAPLLKPSRRPCEGRGHFRERTVQVRSRNEAKHNSFPWGAQQQPTQKFDAGRDGKLSKRQLDMLTA